VADFGLRVVVDRPPADVDYTMVIYGDLGEQTFAGVAPYIDCEDLRPGDTSFTQAFSGSNTGSTVILQEAAHTWGLEHVDAEFDILNPFKSAGKHQVFLDDCFRIVSDTDLNPTPGSCNQVHTRFCESGWQNSYREMSMLFGPPIPDVTPPELTIVYPKDGSTFVAPTTFALSGEIEDELHPQIYYIEVFRDGDTLVGQTNDIGLNLNIIDPEPGEYDLLVRITDEGGNATEQRVGFTVLPEGSELPPSPDVDDEASDGCRLGAPRRPSRGWAAIGMGLLLVVGQNRKRNG
jgi:hypothetical protein